MTDNEKQLSVEESQESANDSPPRQNPRSPEEHRLLATEISQALGETDKSAYRQILAIVNLYGMDISRELLKESLDLEANGGMMINSGERKRTLGGIFFFISMGRATPEQRLTIRSHQWGKKGKNFQHKSNQKKQGSQQQAPDNRLAFPWEENKDLLRELLQENGELHTVKITIIGRPGRIDTSQKDIVMTTMINAGSPTNLPKGMPAPPKSPTNYVVYIGLKQWKKVEDAIKNPEDALIVEGYCAYDAGIPGIGVYATSITTKILQRAKWAQEKGESSNGESAKAPVEAKASAPKPVTSAAPKPIAAPTPPTAPAVPQISQEEAAKLIKDLYTQEDEAREAMDEIKTLPPTEQTGLGAALRELQRIKNEIKTLKQQFPGI